MAVTFIDRKASRPGRVKITPEDGSKAYYAVLERADEPTVTGTALNAASLNEAQENLVYQDSASVHTYKRVYVATNGNDANTGASTSVPMATIRAAIRKYAKWHKYLDIYLADGEYTENIGTISTDNCSLSIRSTSSNKDVVTLNMDTMLEAHINQFRLYNMTINMTATGIRAISINAGTFYANNVRISSPTDSTAACVNVYNGASAFLSECIINSGANAAIYGNQALLIRAYQCTSERTIELAFYANNGALIEYDTTMTATKMTRELNGGKCIPLTARVGTIDGSMESLSGQYMTFDGLLLQWGAVSITPSAANVATGATVTFPISYAVIPSVFLAPVTQAPDIMSVGVMRSGDYVSDATKQVGIMLVRTNTTATTINWLAIGKGTV